MLYDEKLIDFAVGEKSEEKLAVQTYKYNKGVSVRKKRNCPECFEVGPTHQGKKQSKAKISRGFGSLSLSLSVSLISAQISLCVIIVIHLSHALGVYLSIPQPLKRCHVFSIKRDAWLLDESGEWWSLRVVDFSLTLTLMLHFKPPDPFLLTVSEFNLWVY